MIILHAKELWALRSVFVINLFSSIIQPVLLLNLFICFLVLIWKNLLHLWLNRSIGSNNTKKESWKLVDVFGQEREGRFWADMVSLVYVPQRSCEAEKPLTELIKVRVDSWRTGNRTDQPGFEEGGPAVDQTPFSPKVILDQRGDEKQQKREGWEQNYTKTDSRCWLQYSFRRINPD